MPSGTPVSLSKNDCSRDGLPYAVKKKSDAMNDEPKKQEPEIMPPVPKMEPVEPERPGPEIPPDKDVPEKESPIRASNGALLWN
jgi:hypothetical protein